MQLFNNALYAPQVKGNLESERKAIKVTPLCFIPTPCKCFQ